MSLLKRCTDRAGWTLGLMAVAGLLVRAAAVLARKTYLQDFSQTDRGSIAHSLASGAGYLYHGLPSSFFGPVYTQLWAFFLKSMGPDTGELALQLLQALLLALAPVLLYPFARLYLERGTALLAAAWLAFYPEFLLLSTTMFSESLLVFLWCAVLALFALMIRDPRNLLGKAAVLGLVAGLMVLTKGRMLPFVMLLLAALAWRQEDGRRWALAALVGLVFLGGVMAPWIARNHRVHERIVLTESSLGFNLWMGHNAAATGTGKARLGISNYGGGDTESAVFPKSPGLMAELAAAPSEIERDGVYHRQALADMKARGLGGELALSLKKMFYAWWIDPTNKLARSPVYWGPWALTLILFLIGLLHRIVRERRYDWMLYLLLLVSTALQVLFFVIPRLRYPFYPIAFLFAAQGLAALRTGFRRAKD